jgi:hypothetical protein
VTVRWVDDEGTPVAMVARTYRGDGVPHLYVGADLEDPGVEYLTPPGHGEFYPDRHLREMVAEDAGPGLWDACPRCARWAAGHRCTIAVTGRVSVSWTR